MEAMQHVKNGSISSQHTWAYRTTSFHNCYQEQKEQQQCSQTQRCLVQQLKKERNGHNYVTTQIHPHQHHQRPSSNSLQTTPRRHGPRSLQATLQQVCNTCWKKKHRLPYKTSQTKIWQQQLWRVLLNMGIWACTLWAWQQGTTSRPSKDSCSHEWDNRTASTTLTLTPQRQRNTNICRSEDNNHGILQDHDSVLKTPTTIVLIGQYKSWRRPCSSGHWSNIQRQRKRKRKEQRKRTWQRQQRKRIPTRKSLWRPRRIQQRKSQRKTTTMVPAKRRRQRQQRKGKRNA